jgi:hypothetical protein
MRTTMNQRQRSTSVSAHRAPADTVLHLCHGTMRLHKANVVGAVYQTNTLQSVIDAVMVTKTDTDRVLGATTTDSQAVIAQGKDKTTATGHATALLTMVGSVVVKG